MYHFKAFSLIFSLKKIFFSLFFFFPSSLFRLAPSAFFFFFLLSLSELDFFVAFDLFQWVSMVGHGGGDLWV